MGAFGSSPGKTRTCDKSVNSRLLYQLSYRGLGCFDLKLYSRLIRQRRSAYGGVYQLSYRGLDCIKLRISSRLIRQRRKLQGIIELSSLFYPYIFGNG